MQYLYYCSLFMNATISLVLSLLQLQGQGLGLTEMINAMAAQQHMYTAAAAYGSLEAAAYAQYPQYVAQVSVSISGHLFLFLQ